MGEVVDITTRRNHIESDIVCLHCKHKWHGIAPAGTTSLECPECGLMKGVFTSVTLPESYLECNCGCAHCFVSGEGNIICANCGVIHKF